MKTIEQLSRELETLRDINETTIAFIDAAEWYAQAAKDLEDVCGYGAFLHASSATCVGPTIAAAAVEAKIWRDRRAAEADAIEAEIARRENKLERAAA